MAKKIVETTLIFEPNCVVRKVVEIPDDKAKEKEQDETEDDSDVLATLDEDSRKAAPRQRRK